MPEADVQERPPVTITEQAAAIIQAAFANNPDIHIVRFSVESTDAGLRHDLRLETESAPDDIVFEQYGLAMAVSESQVPLLAGTTIDYREDGDQGRFVVANPNRN